jgi:hypothetical protein
MRILEEYHSLCRSPRKCSLVALLLFTTFIFVNSPAHAADSPAFALYKLSVADEIQDLLVEDLNADSLKDILIVHRKGLPPKETRWISIFWQKPTGSFSGAADQSWEIDSAATVLDIGNVTGDERMEICYLTSNEIRYYPISSGGYKTVPEVLFKARGMTVFPSKNSIPLINFVRDWNNDGQDEVAVFGFEGLSIYMRNAEGAFSSENKILIELKTEMGQVGDETDKTVTPGLWTSFAFPSMHLVDYDNDKRNDLILTTRDRVIIYRQGPDGRFSKQADADVFFDVLTQHEKIEAQCQVETEVMDLNEDGYADVLVTKQTSKGLTSFRGVINVFWGGPGGFHVSPDQVIISEGTASGGALIRDVNNDGRKDLILPSVKLSIAAIIRILLTRSFSINYNVFFLSQNNHFSDRPDFTKEVKFKIDISGQSDEQAINFDGDYNGDKRKDFIFGTNEEELSIYLGVPSGGELISKKPVAKVTADAFGELSSPDLNGDGYSDMIIRYWQKKERKGIIEVLMNQRRLK